MKRTWTIIGVSDVPSSFKWYQSLFGQPETRPAHDYFGQILDSDGTVLLCLHQWGAHEHPTLTSPDNATLHYCFHRLRALEMQQPAIVCISRFASTQRRKQTGRATARSSVTCGTHASSLQQPIHDSPF